MRDLVQQTKTQNFKIEEEKDSTSEYLEPKNEAPKPSTFVDTPIKKSSEDTTQCEMYQGLGIQKYDAGSYSMFDLATAQQQQKMDKMIRRENNFYGLHI
mmetsp:Transcript_15392/g.17101  ORF Transcript_15392/g.17101 Transcript_15392/m.17101 type:complete len:99 (+) Transcript_15392:402-698(+)